MDAFEAFSHGEPDVKPQHRSLYYFLLGYARKRGNVPRFVLPFEVGMHGSGIGSWSTYDAAIKALAQWGFLVYTPGANRYRVPIVELTFRNPSGDELLTYWQAYCLAYPVELQKQHPSPVIELQNSSSTPPVELQKKNPTPGVERQNCSSTASPSGNSTGDIKKTFRHKTYDTSASAENGSVTLSQNSSLPVDRSLPTAVSKPGPVLRAGLNVSFDEFWQAYGKKVGRHKSELKWKALTPAERVDALAAVPAYVASKPELQFRKDPLSWLGGKHWQDELPSERAALRPLPLAPAGPASATQPDLNPEVVAQRQAQREAEAAAARQRVRAGSQAS